MCFTLFVTCKIAFLVSIQSEQEKYPGLYRFFSETRTYKEHTAKKVAFDISYRSEQFSVPN